MASRDDIVIEITPQVLLKAYACGIFPMAESADDPALYWIEPQQRGILPLDQVHVPRRLARTIRQGVFEVRIDSDFEGVIDGCAASRPGRRTTWINRKIRGLYRELFDAGYCHTVETWAGRRAGRRALRRGARRRLLRREHVLHRARRQQGGARPPVRAPAAGGFTLLDTQFVTEHLKPVRRRRDRPRRVPHAAREGAGPPGRLPRPADRRQPAAGPRHRPSPAARHRVTGLRAAPVPRQNRT